eukprot:6841462-Lingulodinium_polyedra.AAC.1
MKAVEWWRSSQPMAISSPRLSLECEASRQEGSETCTPYIVTGVNWVDAMLTDEENVVGNNFTAFVSDFAKSPLRDSAGRAMRPNTAQDGDTTDGSDLLLNKFNSMRPPGPW